MMSRLELVHQVEGHKGRVWNVAWHPKGTCFASCGEDKKIRIWSQSDSSSAPTTKTILSDGHTRTIRSICFSPCGKYLASGSFDSTTAIWSATSNEFECNVTLEGHDNEVKSVSWNGAGNLLATCSRDKSVWIWEVTGDDEFDCSAVMNSHSQDVKKVCWHPTEDLLASASYDNTIKIYRENTLDSDWECISTLASHDSTVWSIDFDATGERLVSCSDDRTLKIWQCYLPGNEEGIATPDNVPKWKCVCTISGEHSRAIYDVSWDKNTGLIATACGDDTIRIFQEDSEHSSKNLPILNLVAKIDGAHSQDVNTVTWNPKQPGQLLSCSDDGTIKIWKMVDNP